METQSKNLEKFLIKEVLSITDFQEINATHTIEIKQFIRNVIDNNRDKEDKRIFLENIQRENKI